jgi:hypothetical protein
MHRLRETGCHRRPCRWIGFAEEGIDRRVTQRGIEHQVELTIQPIRQRRGEAMQCV